MATKKKSLKQRMKEKKEELKRKSSNSSILRQKEEGTMRVRILPVGEDTEFVFEITQFWLGKDVGSCISPVTLGEPCAIMEKYTELKESGDESDKEIAKKLMPKRRYVIPVLVYKDDKGKTVNTEDSGKLLQVTGGLYQSIIDLYLDEDEWGDMTDPKEGYDLKITREGLGMTDTEYSVQPCKNTPINKAFRKEIDLEKMVRAEVATYEETETKLGKFMGTSDEGDDDKTPKKKKKGLKRKKRRRDI